MQNILNKLKLNKNKLLLIGIILIVIIGIPLTIMQSQKQQEIRQRAFEGGPQQPDVALKLVRTDVDPASTDKDIRINSKFPVEIHLINNQELDISAFTIIINYGSEFLELSNFSPEPKNPNKGGFDPIIIEDSTPGILQYTAVNSDIEIETKDQDILIGTLAFKAIKEANQAAIKFDQVDTQVTALEREIALLVDFQDQETHKIVPIPPGSVAFDLGVKIGELVLTPQDDGKLREFILRPVGQDAKKQEFIIKENFEYDDKSKSFKGKPTFRSDITFPPGNYTIETKKTLRKLIGSIDPKQQTQLAPITLVLGDLNQDNLIDILDFNMIRDCFGNINSDGCKTYSVVNPKIDPKAADIDENGVVDGIDYNIFLRGLAIREGD